MLTHVKRSIKYSLNSVKNIIQQPIIVLLYHRVIDLDFDPQLLSVSVSNFREQLLFHSKRILYELQAYPRDELYGPG